MRSSAKRDVNQALIIFLFKLRTGNSNELVASVFGLENKGLVSEYSKAIIDSFNKDIWLMILVSTVKTLREILF
jgi:hypothetical protein